MIKGVLNNLAWVRLADVDSYSIREKLTVLRESYEEPEPIIERLYTFRGGWLGMPRAWAVENIPDVTWKNEMAEPAIGGWPSLAWPDGWGWWPGQERAVEAVVDHLRLNPGGLLEAPCGTGKTLMGLAVAAALNVPTLVVVHKGDLANQWKCTAVGGVRDGKEVPALFPGCRVGHVQANKWNYRGSHLVTALAQTLYSRRNKLPDDFVRTFGLVIYDECFSGNTPVDGRAIRDFKAGDAVTGYDHETGQPVVSKVIHVFKSRPRSLVRVRFSNGTSVVCTVTHPFYDSGIDKYVAAGKLVSGTLVQPQSERGVYNDYSDVRCMRGALRKGVQNANLLQEVRRDSKEPATQAPSCYAGLPSVRETRVGGGAPLARAGSLRELCLFTRLQESVVVERVGGNQQATCFGSNEEEQSNAPIRSAREGLKISEADRALPSSSRREWHGDDRASETVVDLFRLGVGIRGHSTDWETRRRVADSLFDRRGTSSIENSNRSGRAVPFLADSPGIRQAKNQIPPELRVDRVEILEQTSDGTFGGLCSDGYVYNLEVAGVNNYYANGVLVHNCHRYPAETFIKVLAMFPAANRLGVSATFRRKDGMACVWSWHVGSIAHRLMADRLVGQYFQVNFRSAISNNLFKYRGMAGLISWVAKHAKYNAWLSDQCVRARASGRRVLLVSDRVDQLCDIRRRILSADTFVGSVGLYVSALPVEDGGRRRSQTREQLDAALRSDVILATYGMVSEGTDVPALDTLIFATPRSDVEQVVGRIQRVYRGKRPLVIVDPVFHAAVTRALAKKRERFYLKAGFKKGDTHVRRTT